MENSLIVKEVDFNGDTLLAVKENESNKIYVSVSYVCNGIGLTENQKDRQVKNIQLDIVLQNGSKMLPVKFDAQVRNVLCIELDYLPLWLAKISITPKMKKENPDVVDKLINYQLKAKDVLAKAFLPENQIDTIIQDYLQLDEDERAIIFFQERKRRKQLEQEKMLLEEKTKELEPKAKSFEQLISAKNYQTMNQVAKAFKTGRNRLFKFLRSKEILMDDNLPYQQYIEQGYFVVREYTVPMNGELVNKTQTLVTGKGIDFIDKLLKEIDYNLDKNKDLLKQAN